MSAPHRDGSGPGRHHFDLPEVTFFARTIARPTRGPQHRPMPALLRTLLQPLNLAALLTWGAVALAMRAEPAANHGLIAVLMGVYLVLLFLNDMPVLAMRGRQAVLLGLQAACALALCFIATRNGTAPVLLVIVAAQVAMVFPPRVSVPALLLLNVGLYLALRANGHNAPLLVTCIYVGFQAFAALTGHYARSAERARDALLLVNADLLATRALLADSARDAERLRVARELHDVAGHKLTAMTLNLRVLAADPAFAGRNELDVSQRMAAELLGDIRNVVQALRDTRGLDLATALRALAAPMPRPALELHIDDTVQIDDPARAEAVLRIVQEALTNTARHGDARTLRVDIHRAGRHVVISLQDDGRVRGPLRLGNGLTGMRERVEGAGGTVVFDIGDTGALQIRAELPA